MISERFPPKTAGTAFARSPFFSSGSGADLRLALQGLALVGKVQKLLGGLLLLSDRVFRRRAGLLLGLVRRP